MQTYCNIIIEKADRKEKARRSETPLQKRARLDDKVVRIILYHFKSNLIISTYYYFRLIEPRQPDWTKLQIRDERDWMTR